MQLKFTSEVLVLRFPDADGEVVLVRPDKPVPNGGRVPLLTPIMLPAVQAFEAAQGRF